jgi:hypothetical protein
MSTKTSFKRIALVAVAALGMGVLTSVSPAKAADVTGTVSPVRYSETAQTRDLVPYSQIAWTASTGGYDTGDTVTVLVTSAPTADAVVELSTLANIGSATDNTWNGAAAGSDSLNLVGVGTMTLGASVLAGATKLGITASKPGRYTGTIKIMDNATTLEVVSFDFTTVGAPASYTVTSDAVTSSPGGVTNHTITLLDGAGKTTQPGAFDSFALTDGTSTGSFTDPDVSALDIALGTFKAIYTAQNTASLANTLTFTPAGVLAGLAAKTVTVTSDATVIDATAIPNQGSAPSANANNTSFAITVPAGITDADTGGDVNNSDITAAIANGTSAITFTALMAAASTTYRFKIAVQTGGTVNGVADANYVNATTPATAPFLATVSFTLGGNALAQGATTTITQVNVANGAVSGLSAVLTQTAPSITAASITQDVTGSVVRKLGVETPIKVTVKTSFGSIAPAGQVVNLYRGATVSGGTFIGTASTGADGVATVTAKQSATAVVGDSEQYSVQVVPTIGSAVADDGIATIKYTVDGLVTALSVAITGVTGGTTTPITATTLAADVTVLPAILVPTDGTADDATGVETYTVLSGAVSGGTGTAEVFVLAANATDDNTSTYTASAGAFVSSTASTLWSAGVSTLQAAEGASVYVFATKTGLHTITITSGGKTSTVKFWAYNLATDYYSVSAVAETLKPAAGSNTLVTLTIKDVFGNGVDAADGLVTATAEGKVRVAGQALSQSLNTAADGTAKFTVVGDGVAGAGTITFAPSSTGAQAWATGYVAPTGAAAPAKTASLTFAVSGGTTDLVTLVNSLIKKINAMQSLLNKIQKRLGVK